MTAPTIPHLLKDARDEITRVAARRRVLLALDFDGTISPIAPTPEQARVSPRAANAIARLRAMGDTGLRVALVSGRRIAELERLAPPVDIRIGLHGFEVQEGDGPPRIPFDTRASDAAIAELLTRMAPLVALGARVEDKHHALALHVRGLDAERAAVAVESFAKLVGDLIGAGAPITMLLGKALIEARPAAASKATALAAYVAPPRPSALVFAGDDATDEEVFVAFPTGLTIAVLDVERPTAARMCLRDPDEVAEFLEIFADARATR